MFNSSSAEDNNTIHFGYDKELNGSNELINRPKTLIENDEQPLNKFKKTFSIKEEVFEKYVFNVNMLTAMRPLAVTGYATSERQVYFKCPNLYIVLFT